jgi:hypothetical protein
MVGSSYGSVEGRDGFGPLMSLVTALVSYVSHLQVRRMGTIVAVSACRLGQTSLM